MTELLSLSVAIFAGLMMTRVMSRWRLPDVTAYLVAGFSFQTFFVLTLSENEGKTCAFRQRIFFCGGFRVRCCTPRALNARQVRVAFRYRGGSVRL